MIGVAHIVMIYISCSQRLVSGGQRIDRNAAFSKRGKTLENVDL